MQKILCPICNSFSNNLAFSPNYITSKMKKTLIKASGSDSRGRYIYRCVSCTVYFCHPIPDQTALFEAYASGSDENFVSQNIFRYKTFKSSFEKFIRSSDFILPNVKITDIGAASGVFLKVIKDLGGDAHGIEANSWLVNYGKSLYKVNLTCGSILNFTGSQESVEIVTLWDVFEHLTSPNETLIHLSSQLKIGSMVFVSLPSTDSKTFKILKWRWPMHLDVHLYYFNKKSLEKLFSSFDFHLIYESKYPQTLSLGYVIFRALKIMNPKLKEKYGEFLISNFLNLIPVKYSVGQRIYVFKKA